MKKTFAWIFAVILIIANMQTAHSQEDAAGIEEENVGTVYTPKEQQTQTNYDYSSPDFYKNTDPTSWDYSKVDWAKVPTDKIQYVPSDRLDFGKLTPSQRQYVTAQQLGYSDNLQKAGNLRDLNPAAVKTALAEKYNGVDVTVGTGFTVNGEGIADNDGVKINLAQYSSKNKIEAIADGWIIDGNKITGTIENIALNEDGSFNVDDNIITFTGDEPDKGANIDANGNILVTGKASGTLTVGDRVVDFESRSGTFSFSANTIQADDASATGTDFSFDGKGSVKFDDSGTFVSANIEAYSAYPGKQSKFTYKETTATTTGHPVTVFANQNDFEKSAGNKAYISDNSFAAKGAVELNKGDIAVKSKNEDSSMAYQKYDNGNSLTTAKGIITIEDSNSKYEGLQDAANMRKETRPSISGKDADVYSVDGNEGNIATITKKMNIASAFGFSDSKTTIEIGKEKGKISASYHMSDLQSLTQDLRDPSAVIVINRELYIQAGDQGYLGINSEGMGRFENKNGNSDVFSPAIAQSALRNRVLALNDAEINSLNGLTSLQADKLKEVDVASLKQNKDLMNYLEKNSPINLDKLESVLQNPDSQASKDYFNLIEKGRQQREQGLNSFKSAQSIEDKTNRAIATAAALEQLVQSRINLATANDKDASDLIEQRRVLRGQQRIFEISKINNPVEQAAKLRELKNNPEYADFASKALAAHFNTLADETTSRESISLFNRHLALKEDPNNKDIQKALQRDEQIYLQKILAYSTAHSEDVLKTIEGQSYLNAWDAGILTTTILDKVFEIYEMFAKDTRVSAAAYEQERLIKENMGIRQLTRLHDQGYTLDEIREITNNPIKVAEIYNLDDIHSTDPEKRHKASVMANQLRENLDLALRNDDVEKIRNPTGAQFNFETGKSYADTSFMEGKGGLQQFVEKQPEYAFLISPLLYIPGAAEFTETLVEESTTPLGLLTQAFGGEIIGATVKGLQKTGAAGASLVRSVGAKGTAEFLESDVSLLTKGLGAGTKAAVTAEKETAEQLARDAKLAFESRQTAEGVSDLTVSTQTKEAASILEGKYIVARDAEGFTQTFTKATATSDGLLLEEPLTVGAQARTATLTIPDSELKSLQVLTRETPKSPVPKPDFETKAALDDIVTQNQNLASKAALQEKIANSGKTFKPLTNSEIDDAIRNEIKAMSTREEIQKMKIIESDLHKLKTLDDVLASAGSDAEITSAAVRTKATIDNLVDSATKNNLHYAIQASNTGEDVALLSLSRDTMKAVNKIDPRAGDGLIAAFRKGISDSVGPDVRVAFNQKQVVLFGKGLTDDEINAALSNGLKEAKLYRSTHGLSVSDISGRTGRSTIQSGRTVEEAALTARSKAEIASKLTQKDKPIDLQALKSKQKFDEIKNLGGEYRIQLNNRLATAKEKFLREKGLTNFNSEYDDLAEEFLKTLGPEEQALLLDVVPQGSAPDLVALTRKADAAKSSLDDLVKRLESKEITDTEFRAAIKKQVEPIADDLENVVYQHDKFNQLNGIDENIVGRKKWFADASDNVKPGDYVLSADVNNMADYNIKTLAAKLSDPTSQGLTIDEKILQASMMKTNPSDVSLIKTINRIDNALKEFAPAGSARSPSVGVVAGDEILMNIPKEVGDEIIKRTGKQPAEYIRSVIESSDISPRGIRMSVGQAVVEPGDDIVSAVHNADVALNVAKDTVLVGAGKNTAAVMRKDKLMVDILTDRPDIPYKSVPNPEGKLSLEFGVPRKPIKEGLEALASSEPKIPNSVLYGGAGLLLGGTALTTPAGAEETFVYSSYLGINTITKDTTDTGQGNLPKTGQNMYVLVSGKDILSISNAQSSFEDKVQILATNKKLVQKETRISKGTGSTEEQAIASALASAVAERTLRIRQETTDITKTISGISSTETEVKTLYSADQYIINYATTGLSKTQLGFYDARVSVTFGEVAP